MGTAAIRSERLPNITVFDQPDRTSGLPIGSNYQSILDYSKN